MKTVQAIKTVLLPQFLIINSNLKTIVDYCHKFVARVLPGFPNTREQWNSLDCSPSDVYYSREFAKHS